MTAALPIIESDTTRCGSAKKWHSSCCETRQRAAEVTTSVVETVVCASVYLVYLHCMIVIFSSSCLACQIKGGATAKLHTKVKGVCW